jgi:hypothetical protein
VSIYESVHEKSPPKCSLLVTNIHGIIFFEDPESFMKSSVFSKAKYVTWVSKRLRVQLHT